MGSAIILAAAAAAATPGSPGPPDIAIRAKVRAREVTIEQQGEARIRLWAEPSAGDKVEVDRNLPKGQRRYRNLELELDAEARLAAPGGRETRQQPPAGEQ